MYDDGPAGRDRIAPIDIQPTADRHSGEIEDSIDTAELVARALERRATAAQKVIGLSTIAPRARSELMNRAVNFMLALVALIVLAPVMLVVALAIRLSSPGPVINAQTRVGIDRRRRRADAIFDRRHSDHGGLVFTIYKFRSMRVDAETKGAVWALPNDPRVTPIGKRLRQLRLDELPQLYNVLKGDMNIVGPRPERPSIFARLREDISDYPLRQRTKPGLTGWAQVNQAYDANMDDVRSKVRYDLEYIQRQSLAEDLKIMLKTVPVVLFRRGGW
ncbi:MAG: sugar transferase [Gemmatimonadota bacterium]|nr:sugar transferase [Gemmatimonadota bacterium]